MIDKQLISTIKYVAGTKPVFLLSEIIPYLDEPLSARSVDQLYLLLAPDLKSLNLTAAKKASDYEISTVGNEIPYLLSEPEGRRLDAFFSGFRIPEPLERSIEDYIARKAGKAWDDPATFERLRRAIVAQKDDYWKPTHQRSLKYTKGYSVLGYLAYHFPVYYMQTERLLAMLAREGLLKNSMNILDIGTGPGVVPLAIADFWSRLDHARAVVYSVERSEEHIEAFMYLRERCTAKGANASIKPPVKTDIRNPDMAKIPGKIDLMIFSNVINELGDIPVGERADAVMVLAERLESDGSILIIEPAEEVTSTQLRAVSLALKKRGLTIYSPCSFIHGTNCTPDRCWSFVVEPGIHPTQLMETLAACEEPFRYRNTDIKYSYVVLRKDGKVREPFRVPAGSDVLRLSQVHRHVDKRVDVIAAKMSENLGDIKNRMFRLCDGSSEKPVFGVLPVFHVTPENERLVTAPYGTVLEIDNVLIRYNPKHDAYNLLVNRNSVVRDAGRTEEDLP